MPDYSYQIDGSAFNLYPTETHFGLFELVDGSEIDIFQQFPFGGEWGKPMVDCLPLREQMPLPRQLDIVYLSITENMFYYLSLPINSQELDKIYNQLRTMVNTEEIIHLIVGMAPYGGIALWLGCVSKQILLGWVKSQETNLSMEDFLPQNPRITLIDYCKGYIDHSPYVRENLKLNGLPARNIFDRYMQQFCYRYLMMFERWNEKEERWVKPELDKEGQPVDGKPLPEFDYIEEALYDGTHDKLHDGGLMNYHQAGKPKKLAIEWHIKKSQYSAYLWFEDEAIRSVFEKFYGAHRDTKADFIIRIDAEKKKYELALYRYGLQEPVVINEEAYQMIVFKSKFEYYRTENYDQPQGAWNW